MTEYLSLAPDRGCKFRSRFHSISRKLQYVPKPTLRYNNLPSRTLGCSSTFIIVPPSALEHQQRELPSFVLPRQGCSYQPSHETTWTCDCAIQWH